MPIKNEEAIKTLNEILEKQIFIDSTPQNTTINAYEAIETVLNMLKEKDKEIEKLKADNKKAWKLNANMTQRHLSDIFKIKKKDKQIDLMARAIDNYDSQLEINTFRDKEHVKQYFKEIAEQSSNIN